MPPLPRHSASETRARDVCLPWRLSRRGVLQGLCLPDRYLSQPFLADGIALAARDGAVHTVRRRTQLGAHPSLLGSVFHPSRSGSTLLCALIDAARGDDGLTVREPRWAASDIGSMATYQLALASLLTRPHWVKWSSDMLLDDSCGLVMSRSPRTVFLIRTPADVVASNVRRWPTWVCRSLVGRTQVRNPDRTIRSIVASQIKTYFDRLLVLRETCPGVLVLRYESLCEYPVESVEAVLGSPVRRGLRARVMDAARLDSKRPRVAWSPRLVPATAPDERAPCPDLIHATRSYSTLARHAIS